MIGGIVRRLSGLNRCPFGDFRQPLLRVEQPGLTVFSGMETISAMLGRWSRDLRRARVHLPRMAIWLDEGYRRGNPSLFAMWHPFTLESHGYAGIVLNALRDVKFCGVCPVAARSQSESAFRSCRHRHCWSDVAIEFLDQSQVLQTDVAIHLYQP